jgi:hypothetical protein
MDSGNASPPPSWKRSGLSVITESTTFAHQVLAGRLQGLGSEQERPGWAASGDRWASTARSI